MRMRLVAVGALAIVAGCRLFVDLEGLGDGTAPDAGDTPDATTSDVTPVVDASDEPSLTDAGTDAEVDAADAEGGGACPLGTVPGATSSYCIDSTEVTVAKYDLFLAGTPNVAAQPAECAWNTSFAPVASGSGTWPVRGVDWCDARAYCASVGKRLCGRIGGGVLDPPGAVSAAASEWVAACTAGGTRTFPYGNTYDSQKCVGKEHDGGNINPFPVGSSPLCEGGVDGLFDMSGNVFEWQAACNTAGGSDAGVRDYAADDCVPTGGDFGEIPANMECRATEIHKRSEAFPWIGFRCCVDR